MTLLYGKNGIGKTTFLKLLSGFYKPSQGKIFIGSKNLKEALNEELLSSQIFFLSSTPFIYSGTVLENIFSFSITDKKEKLFYSLQLDKIFLFIKLDINSFVLRNGENLSSGQKQIISFCSLFFNECKIILLDESLNCVSKKIKNLLMEKLHNFFSKSVIFYVTVNEFIGENIGFFNKKINFQKLILS